MVRPFSWKVRGLGETMALTLLTWEMEVIATGLPVSSSEQICVSSRGMGNFLRAWRFRYAVGNLAEQKEVIYVTFF